MFGCRFFYKGVKSNKLTATIDNGPGSAEPGYTLCLCKQCRLDQLASEEASWSGSAMFDIKCVNLYQQPGSNNLTGWKLEVGVAS